MAKAYSADMRQRVIDRVESGASRRKALEHYEVSPNTAVIWVKCFPLRPRISDGYRSITAPRGNPIHARAFLRCGMRDAMLKLQRVGPTTRHAWLSLRHVSWRSLQI
jgi:Transposase